MTPDEQPAAAAGLRGLRAVLREQPFVAVAQLTIPDPRPAALLGASGADVVILDAEHSPFTLPDLRSCLDAIAPTPAWAVARVATNDAALIKQVLELGPDGILVPMVRTAEEAGAAVAACRYPPDGVRGVGVGRAQGYGLSAERYYETANASVAALVIVESAEGVANAPEIAAVEGLDGILIGPQDLAADLGLGVQPGHPDVQRGIDAVIDAANAAGVPAGSVCPPEELAAKLDRGMRLPLMLADFQGLLSATRDAYSQVAAERDRRRAR